MDRLQFLYMIRPTRVAMLTEGLTRAEEEIVSSHFQYLRALARKGVVILAGRTLNDDETTVGIVVFQADSEDEATRVMHADPAVKAGVMRAELYPFHVAVADERLAQTGQDVPKDQGGTSTP